MRRIALPLTLLVFACESDTTPATTDTESSSGTSEDPSSSSGTAPTTTLTTTSDTDTDTTTGVAESSSSSGDENSEDPTVDPDTGPGYLCGDGEITPDFEVCEGTDFGANNCMTEGFMQGELECSNDCLGFNTDACYTCGNTIIEGTEECDGELSNSIDCESEGYTEGEITCITDTCLYDVSNCTLCGDGVREGNELCDGSDFGDATCASIGFDSGDLDCDALECGITVANCIGGSFTADFETGAFAEQFEQAGNQEWEIEDEDIITGAFSARSGNISDSQNSILRLEVGFPTDGTVEFTHREDCQCGDGLEFRVDGTPFQTWQCQNGPQSENFPIDAGNHTFEWRFQKDAFNSQGADAAFVDDIIITGGVAF